MVHHNLWSLRNACIIVFKTVVLLFAVQCTLMWLYYNYMYMKSNSIGKRRKKNNRDTYGLVNVCTTAKLLKYDEKICVVGRVSANFIIIFLLGPCSCRSPTTGKRESILPTTSTNRIYKRRIYVFFFATSIIFSGFSIC